ncbi:MAG: 30S ribosomal protein S1 [Deltaproteobacteria bacterium]|jgi:small subunit ribosomal protein S1|nr:30S ribosomal protein S1 [Deltaproteobacteria bacterium]MBW2383431.1 30S ribosomal protein S1 [Deltaproteobacteria bacterium]MBW2695101.1 30S ribosomal protein S1 [Deltaproteobacteria bacterium]
MTETINSSSTEPSFAELMNSGTPGIKEGEIARGKVLSIDDDFVQVDVGFKSEGMIAKWEFMEEDGTLTIAVGDTVEVLVEEGEDEDGRVILSKEKAERLKVWDEISDAYEGDRAVEGTIVARVKGGLSVDIGVKAFLPGSQVDLRPVRNLEGLIGDKAEFKIIKFNKRRGNIVLSRRALLETERRKLRETTLGSLESGQILDGVIKNLTDYGAFIDLGGIDGLLHITDMSWGRINHPSELFNVGDEIKVKVLKFDPESERVSLGLKQIQPDPWVDAALRYPIGKRLKGRVVSLTDYGAFIELEPGIEGLVHVSEMSWTKRIKHPSKVVSISDDVEAVVLDVDERSRKISLGMKQIEDNPWTVIEDRYPVGSQVTGQVRNITNFGVFVGLEEGIDGLVHVSDISWTEQIKHPSEKFQKGDEVEAVVLKIDNENEKFSLGIKQLTPNPWDDIQRKYPIGSEVTGHVSSVTDFGVFVRLEEGIDGLVYSSELAQERVENPADAFSESQEVTALIVKVDPNEQKISLSIRAVNDKAERRALQELAAQQSQSQTTTLGDLLAEKLAQKSEDSTE